MNSIPRIYLYLLKFYLGIRIISYYESFSFYFLIVFVNQKQLEYYPPRETVAIGTKGNNNIDFEAFNLLNNSNFFSSSSKQDLF
jgi:hypothetical protein